MLQLGDACAESGDFVGQGAANVAASMVDGVKLAREALASGKALAALVVARTGERVTGMIGGGLIVASMLWMATIRPGTAPLVS